MFALKIFQLHEEIGHVHVCIMECCQYAMIGVVASVSPAAVTATATDVHCELRLLCLVCLEPNVPSEG